MSNTHTCGNFSLSGQSISTIFFHLFCEVSMSLSKFLNSSLPANEQMPPQLWFERKSTGLVTWGLMGKRRKKSSSAEVISSLMRRTWNILKKHFDCTVNFRFIVNNNRWISSTDDVTAAIHN